LEVTLLHGGEEAVVMVGRATKGLTHERERGEEWFTSPLVGLVAPPVVVA